MKKMRLFTFIFTLLFLILVSAQDLTPKMVAKTGNIDIPEGMHLVTDRTGARWLLPLDMDTPLEKSIKPAEYYKAEVKPHVRGQIGNQQIYSGALSASDTFVDESVFWSHIPAGFSQLLNAEKDLNLHGKSDHFSFLGDYGPTSKKPFLVPYIPIPEKDFEFAYVSEFAKDGTKNFIKTEHNGEVIYRAFIHPNYPENFEELIKKYGIVYHYVGITTSSPRSLIVLDPENPEKLHWVKPSLPKKIDGSVRLNIDTKLRRAVIMSEALASIPKEARGAYGVDFMIEPGAIQFPGKKFGTIYRELNDELVHPENGHSWLPAFALNAPGESGKTILEEMINKSNKPAKEFISESLVRPFLRSYLSLALIEGLPGEFHTQNFYYELNEHGLPTGKFIFKDNDGFRFDVELAMRKKRGLGYLSKFKNPFYWAKFSNALGTGSEGVQFLGSWYYKLIRNVNGFETLSSYILSVMSDKGDTTGLWTKDGIQRLFDDIAVDEAQKMTGVKIAESRKYGFGKDKGVNEVLNLYRTSLAEKAESKVWQSDLETQEKLRKIYDRLRAMGNAHERGSVGVRAYFLPHVMEDGTLAIEARSISPRNEYANPTQALAIVEADSETHKELGNLILEKMKLCEH